MKEIKDKFLLEFNTDELFAIDTAIDIFVCNNEKSGVANIKATVEVLRGLQKDFDTVLRI